MITESGNLHCPASFYTPGYGAYRWDEHLTERAGTWFLVSKSVDFDRMRGIELGNIHITCVVDDFGDLVRVPA